MGGSTPDQLRYRATLIVNMLLEGAYKDNQNNSTDKLKTWMFTSGNKGWGSGAWPVG